MRLGTRRKESDEIAPEVYPMESEDTGVLHDHGLHLDGEICARCGQPIGPQQEARRTAKGGYVHLTC